MWKTDIVAGSKVQIFFLYNQYYGQGRNVFDFVAILKDWLCMLDMKFQSRRVNSNDQSQGAPEFHSRFTMSTTLTPAL